MRMAIYKIQYYERDSRFGWSNAVHDNVLAKSEAEALKKFDEYHNNTVKIRTVVNWQFVDY